MRMSSRPWQDRLLFLPSVAFAQASITGVVKDTSGAVLPGVTVEAASPVLIEKVRTAVTDGSGRYPDRRSASRRLHRHVHAGRLQYVQARRRHPRRARPSCTVDAELRVGALEETVTVTGEAPVVDTSRSRSSRSSAPTRSMRCRARATTSAWHA